MPSIAAVLFDYGLVLTGPPDSSANATMQRVLATGDAALQPAYWHYRDAYDRGNLTGTAYWHSVASDLHRTLTPGDLAALIAADTALWTQPNQPMIDWAAALQRAGIKTGILSNLGDDMERGIRARFPWLAAFHHHTFSHSLGIAKPDPQIYLHAAQGLGLPPERILFVDDRLENIAAARVSGMEAIQYTNHPAFVETVHERFENLPSPA